LKNSKKLKYFFFKIFPLSWAFLIAVLSLLPESEVDKVWFDFFIPLDKMAHFVMYSVLTFFALIYVKTLNLPFKTWSLIIVCSVFIYGIVIEFLQELDFIGRNASFNDVLADLSGVIAGILLFYFSRNLKFFSSENET